MPDSRIKQHAFGDKTDQLTPRRCDAKCLRFGADRLERPMQRRLFSVDEIHRHLRLAVDFEAERFDVAQAA